MLKKCITIDSNAKVPFNNNVDYCVGTGRMGLALHKEYFEQLKIVQDSIGFSYIRGHGLFCDDMAIYQELGVNEYKTANQVDDGSSDGEKKVEYNFTYLDRVVDSYLELNIRPFLELGFMPEKMASGTQTVFYWKGNVTPPKEYQNWCNMVQETLRHLMSRYGREEVLSWPVEVWNEPNLPGFWENADIEEYYKLYEWTAKAVKEVDPEFQVGGPAICGGWDEQWMVGFLKHCSENHLPLDFISRHHYTTELPENKGHYGYPEMMDFEYTIQTLRDCRKIIDSYELYKDLPFYITEFNTSYIPNCPMHDTNLNAAYIAATIAEIGDYVTGYSYWTFGDVFEERGVPFTPFHGGFGMVANGGILKPTFWTFKFFKDIKGDCVYRDRNVVVVKSDKGGYKGVAWNVTMETKEEEMEVKISLPDNLSRKCLLTKTVDEKTCNPLKIWHDMGEPASPTKEQMDILRASGYPLIESQIIEDSNEFTVHVGRYGVVYFEIEEAPLTSDTGYDYEFYAIR